MSNFNLRQKNIKQKDPKQGKTRNAVFKIRFKGEVKTKK